MRTHLLQVRTGGEDVVLDLTDRCADFVQGLGDGLLHVFVPHATAGIAILETGAGSDDEARRVREAMTAFQSTLRDEAHAKGAALRERRG